MSKKVIRRSISFNGELIEKIEYLQNKIFFHQSFTSTVLTLVGFGLQYLEEKGMQKIIKKKQEKGEQKTHESA